MELRVGGGGGAKGAGQGVPGAWRWDCGGEGARWQDAGQAPTEERVAAPTHQHELVPPGFTDHLGKGLVGEGGRGEGHAAQQRLLAVRRLREPAGRARRRRRLPAPAAAGGTAAAASAAAAAAGAVRLRGLRLLLLGRSSRALQQAQRAEHGHRTTQAVPAHDQPLVVAGGRRPQILHGQVLGAQHEPRVHRGLDLPCLHPQKRGDGGSAAAHTGAVGQPPGGGGGGGAGPQACQPACRPPLRQVALAGMSAGPAACPCGSAPSARRGVRE